MHLAKPDPSRSSRNGLADAANGKFTFLSFRVSQRFRPDRDTGRYLRPKLCEAERRIARTLATVVSIIECRGKGHIRITFDDLYEFERLYTFLTGDKMELAYPPRSEKAG